MDSQKLFYIIKDNVVVSSAVPSSIPHLPFDGEYLTPGHHQLDIQAIQAHFVSNSPKSLTRGPIFTGYSKLCDTLSLLGLSVHQMIGGSFPTLKINPADIDIVNCCLLEDLESLTDDQFKALSDYVSGEETKAHCLCHSHIMAAPPDGHQDIEEFQTIRAYWERRFGYDRAGKPKGIVTTTILPPPPAETGDW